MTVKKKQKKTFISQIVYNLDNEIVHKPHFHSLIFSSATKKPVVTNFTPIHLFPIHLIMSNLKAIKANKSSARLKM